MQSKEPFRWSITDWLYRYRHGAFPWFLMTVLGTLFGVASVEFIVWHFDYATAMMIVQSPIWTIIFAIVASPLAYYVWLVRDRNALESRRQIKEAELMKNFHQLQEWVTAETDEAKRVSALLQLQDFAIGAKYLFPDEMAYFKEFQERVLAFLLFLLQHRQLYDQEYHPFDPEGDMSPRANRLLPSPAATAMSQIISKNAHLFPGLERVILDGMNLSYAQMHGIVMNAASAFHAIMDGANLQGSDLKDAAFIGTALDRADLRGANLEGAKLLSVGLSEANLGRTMLSHVDATQVSMIAADLTDSQASGLSFYGCDLQRCGFIAAKLTHSRVIQSKLQKASFLGANLLGTRIEHCALDGTDFTDASLRGVQFRHVDLSRAILTGATYDGSTQFPPETDTSMMIRVK